LLRRKANQFGQNNQLEQELKLETNESVDNARQQQNHHLIF
jgi:hypothetical protein